MQIVPSLNPRLPTGQQQSNGDAAVAFSPDGTLYVAGACSHAVGGFFFPVGAVCVNSSPDLGATWAGTDGSMNVLSDVALPSMLARGLHPSSNTPPSFGANPFDRPWVTVDQSTGVLYASASGHPQRYVVASHHGGRAWGPIYAPDCDADGGPNAHVNCNTGFPAIGGGTIAAAHGVLAADYVASAAPRHVCPCVVLALSTDDGAHWNRSVALDGLPAGTSEAFVAADPQQPNSFAVLTIPAGDTQVLVAATRDAGETWTTPVALGNEAAAHNINRPWLTYSTDGSLVAFWRNSHPVPGIPADGGVQNVFVAISRNHGRTFGDPIRMDSAPSPPADTTIYGFHPGDDVSYVIADKHFVYAAWGDWRASSNNHGGPLFNGQPTGDVNVWVGRVALSHDEDQR